MEARQRAPQRDGQRTTLRVPNAVMQAARELAAELGTTPNDALMRLALDGVEARERRERIAGLARERQQAVSRTQASGDASFGSPEDMRAAMLSGRHAP